MSAHVPVSSGRCDDGAKHLGLEDEVGAEGDLARPSHEELASVALQLLFTMTLDRVNRSYNRLGRSLVKNVW